jgi:hypothetical protein
MSVEMTHYKGVYIIGQTERTGTNFLYNLLLQHPDVHRTAQPGEDRLLMHSSHLLDYVESTSSQWSENWKGMNVHERKSALMAEIGMSLQRFLSEEEKFVITKSPSAIGIENYHKFFTDYFPIILVRDGRNVVESLVSSFNTGYGESMKEWALSVDSIIAFRRQYPDTLLLKYEDLFADPFQCISGILSRLNLDSSKISAQDLEEQDIIGSSQSSNKKGEVDWSKKMDRNQGFDPNKRYSKWNPWIRLKYRIICGQAAKKMNYGY